ncbi:hypothetical protein EI94DRAFT_282978 [Lactarius quietus]|nr:hypothetical protein EI94DRAFT_282978 [Lactarius quietus]
MSKQLLQLIVSSLESVVVARYSTTAVYVVCFYDWIISLDQEVDFIYPSRWSIMKFAYLFCRYYPLAIAPFQLWGLLGDHEIRVCESFYRALYACTIPTTCSAKFILMFRTYAFSERRNMVLAVLSLSFFFLVGINIWVVSKELILIPIFFVVKRSACFAVSGGVVPSAGNATQETKLPLSSESFQLVLISLLSTSFDCLNMLIVIQKCIQDRGTLGPLGQNFLKQGILVYGAMTALNMLSIGICLSSSIYPELRGLGPVLASVLSSALSCRLVLMLRRQASPTQTEIRAQYSHMINEALEMVPI